MKQISVIFFVTICGLLLLNCNSKHKTGSIKNSQNDSIEIVRHYNRGGNLGGIDFIKNGKLNGPSISIQEDTPLISGIVNFTNDSINGFCYSFFLKNGFISGISEIQKGKQTGIAVSYAPNGMTSTWVEWRNGFENGKEIHFFINGNKEFEGKNVDGQRDSIWAYYSEDGNLLKTELYNKGKLIKQNKEN